MAIKKMEHVGIMVNDLATAIEFFVELGLEPRGNGQVEGSWVDRIVALDEVRVEFAMLRTPDGHGEIELVKFTRRQLRAATRTRRRTPRASAISPSSSKTSTP